MSNEKHETVTGIVAKMRREADYIVASAEASVRDGETMAGTPYSSADFDAALAVPPRNCDVGAAEEQGERCMAQFDQRRRKGDGMKLITAIMAWAQMPYEKGGES